VIIDRPVEKGGTDQGPLGGEYLLLALAGCFMSNLLAAARTREIAVAGLTIQAVGTLSASPERLTAATLTLAGHPDKDELRKLATIAERSCIVTNTLNQSLPIRVDIE
jgi:putative redox protein